MFFNAQVLPDHSCSPDIVCIATLMRLCVQFDHHVAQMKRVKHFDAYCLHAATGTWTKVQQEGGVILNTK